MEHRLIGLLKGAFPESAPRPPPSGSAGNNLYTQARVESVRSSERREEEGIIEVLTLCTHDVGQSHEEREEKVEITEVLHTTL